MKEGCRWDRGEDGAFRRFSAKLWRWAEMELGPEPADIETEGDRWERVGGFWDDEEPEAALLRLVELVARVSLSSRDGEGSMVVNSLTNS